MQGAATGRGVRFRAFVGLLGVGALAYLPESLSPTIPDAVEIPLRVSIALVLLATAVLLARSRRCTTWWLPVYGCFVVATAQLIDWYFSDWSLRLLRIELHSPAGYAVVKAESTLLIVVTILALTRASGARLDTLYLKRGNVRAWLRLGGAAFAFFVVTAPFAAPGLFQAKAFGSAEVFRWLPWILLFVFANGLNEELLFRGLLLKKVEPFFGPRGANMLVALLFALWHLGANYTPAILPFMVIVFGLGLACGRIIQKTDSLWGAVLFHAGMDVPVILGLLSNLD